MVASVTSVGVCAWSGIAALSSHAPSGDDRRAILIRRTAKDRALQETYERVSEEMTTVFYRGFEPREIEQFEATLERILANLIEADARGM